MTEIHSIKVYASILLCSVLLAGATAKSASAQNQIEILKADQITGGTVEGKQVQKILGNVHLESENFEMYCDSAYQFVNEDEIRAYGNIQINTPDENIWADSLVYFTDVDFSQLRGRVIIEADTTTVFGESVDYRFSTKVANFIDGIRLEDERGVLTAGSGFYYREADSAVFRQQVQLSDSTQYIEGDSLFSNRSSQYYELYGDIFADDMENNTLLKGDYLEADSTGRRLIEGNAWLRNVDVDSARADTAVTAQPDTTALPPDSLAIPRDSTAYQHPEKQAANADTTHIRAEKIRSVQYRSLADTTTIVDAWENVRIWSERFSSLSDTATYNDRLETFELWSNSKAWYENIQLTGPYIKVTLREGDIDQLDSYPMPFVVQQDTAINRLNQLKGDTLNAYFEEGTMSQMILTGNTQVLNFTSNSEGEADGAIDSQAPESIFFFEEGELAEFKQNGAIKGDYFQENESLADRRLDGFTWNPEQRPQRPEQEMKPRFPPIPGEPPFELPRRYIEHLQNRQESN